MADQPSEQPVETLTAPEGASIEPLVAAASSEPAIPGAVTLANVSPVLRPARVL